MFALGNAVGVLEAKIVWKDAFTVVGEKIRFDPSRGMPPSGNDIAKLWPRFNERVPEIGHVVGGAYGLCVFDADGVPGAPFDYIAGVGVSRADRVPEGMTAHTVSGGLYCVVTRQGVIDELGATFDYFWKEWLPNSGYVYGGGVEYEYYDERYRGNDDPASVMDIWFPIRPAKEAPLENRVASVFIHVTDLRRAADWYSRLLGLPVLEERLNGGPVYWFDLGDTGLVLDSDAYHRQDPSWRESMMPRIMFPAKDIDEAYRYVKERGTPFFEPERHGTMAYFNFADPEGNAQMVCWTAAAEAAPASASGGPIRPRIGGAFVDVKDMRATARWYAELLGVPFDESQAGSTIYSMPVTRGAALLLDGNRHANGESFTEICYFETDDFEAALAYAREQGFEPAGEPARFPDLSEFALLDPDGNRIVIAHMKGTGTEESA
ncbi:hypothetical protein FE782_17755 [Paenibacillus antri]|uniref:VOC domain-containing protein n=1 Tax=Paenibacillus antri TaxID=2582848 RepID=A0A5R9GCL4_9BACL|nr:GyrI-like domain-containing protein [Paenibacillus antri]TLS50894.1 hypothetical protein FE782_17755 [Paenibacillus antri]